MQILFRLDQRHDIVLPQAVVDFFGPLFEVRLEPFAFDFDPSEHAAFLPPVLAVLVLRLQLIQDHLADQLLERLDVDCRALRSGHRRLLGGPRMAVRPRHWRGCRSSPARSPQTWSIGGEKPA